MELAKFNEGGFGVKALPGPYATNGLPTDDAREFARRLIGQVEQLREFAAQKYLALYNDTWRDEEEDEPELTKQQFIERLGTPSIVLYDELGAAAVYFSPNDLFGGHSIEVWVNEFEPTSTTLVG